MNGLKERLNTAEIEIPLCCPSCSRFVGKDLTYYINDDESITCSRCHHADQIHMIGGWNELPDWTLRLQAEWRRLRRCISIRGWLKKRRELQSWAWVFFKDCWKNPQEVQRRAAELREMDEWQSVMMGLDT